MIRAIVKDQAAVTSGFTIAVSVSLQHMLVHGTVQNGNGQL